MEESPVPPMIPGLTREEENALVSQVLEIIGGITHEALQTVDQSEERDVWSVEEGDDSVFYSDEDQSANTDVVADAGEHLISSEADEEPIPLREAVPGAEEGNLSMEMKTPQEFILIEHEEDRKELQTQNPGHVHQSDSADPRVEIYPAPENLVSISGESLQPIYTNADMKTVQNISSETDLQMMEEDLVQMDQTPNPGPIAVTNEESYARLSTEEDVSEEMSSADPKISGNRQIKAEREPEQDCNSHVPLGFHQGLSSGYSTLPLLKKSSCGTANQKAFDHLTASKYSTVSYRKIRRGNTRQKIEEFECMMMNL